MSLCGDHLPRFPQGISSFLWPQMTIRSSGSALMTVPPTPGWLHSWARYVPSSSTLSFSPDQRCLSPHQECFLPQGTLLLAPSMLIPISSVYWESLELS